MPDKVKPIPEGHHTVTPYLIMNDGAKALEFYKKAFNATELYRMEKPDKTIGHAEIRIGNSILMLASECEEMKVRSAKTLGNSPIMLYCYVEDCDAMYKQAVAAGAKAVRPLENQFYGDRSGAVEDPFGYTWHLSTHVEDVTSEEIKKRMEKLQQQKKA